MARTDRKDSGQARAPQWAARDGETLSASRLADLPEDAYTSDRIPDLTDELEDDEPSTKRNDRSARATPRLDLANLTDDGDLDDDEDSITQVAVKVQALEATQDAPAYRPGLVAGRYRIVRHLGTGGMGEVYEAEHVELGKHVAMKVLGLAPTPRISLAEIAARFRREARSASALEHDHIVQVFDAGEDPAFGLFMVMELLKGEDLEHALESRGALPPKVAATIVYQVCLALEAAHAASIVHRDLKPANIFLARGSGDSVRAKIVDFGLAKLMRDVSNLGGGKLTRDGAVLGTPQYVSPEYAQGQATIDARTDIYALGAVFYEALVGQPLVPDFPTYERTLFHILTERRPRVTESVPGIAPALDDLVAAMLAPRDVRVPSARDVRARLLAIFPDLDGARIALPPTRASADASGMRPLGAVVEDADALPMPLVHPGAPRDVTLRALRARRGYSALVTYAALAIAAIAVVAAALAFTLR